MGVLPMYADGDLHCNRSRFGKCFRPYDLLTLQAHWGPLADALAVVEFVRVFGTIVGVEPVSLQVRDKVDTTVCTSAFHVPLLLLLADVRGPAAHS